MTPDKPMETKKYPQLSTFKTSTVLSCARCRNEIAMFSPVVTDGSDYWHDTCAPSQSSGEVHTVETPEDKAKGE